MQMKSPSHPGVIVQIALEELGVSVAEAARSLGVTRQQLHNVITGKSRVTAKMAVRLEKGLGSNADTWLKLQSAYDLAQIRDEGDLGVEPLAPKVAAE
jgi:addiction module HigA family antidote